MYDDSERAGLTTVSQIVPRFFLSAICYAVAADVFADSLSYKRSAMWQPSMVFQLRYIYTYRTLSLIHI